jgi:hypothetical protein
MKLSLIIIPNLSAFVLFSQTPTLVWNKTFGGSQTELFGSFATTSLFFGRWAAVASDVNDQIYIATTSNSNDFDVYTNFGEEDVWVLSLNHQGDTLWTKILGGSGSERVFRVRARSGGGCYVVGHSRSSNGGFASNFTTNSYADGFIASLNADGTTAWLRMYGGSSDDFLHDLIETSDSQLMACGESLSSDGDLSNTGSGLNWIVKINPANGDLIWSKTFVGPDGSSNDRLENLFRLAELSNHEIVLTGYTTPNFNDFNLDRVQIMKINLAGELIWTKKIGAAGGGDYPSAMLPADNGSFWILSKLATTVGGAGQASNFYGGGSDFWLTKLNNNGEIIFEKNYGGTNLDVPYDMLYAAEGSIYLAGMSRSNDLDLTLEGFGLADLWLLKINPNDGSIIYTNRFGGSSNDFCSGIALTQNGNSIFLVGGTDSNDGIISNFKGVRDLWVLRLMYDTQLGFSTCEQRIWSIYPNPAKDFVFIAGDNSVVYATLFDLNGSLVFENKITNGFSVEGLSQGIYFLKLSNSLGINEIHKLVLRK